jgi:hypothetical protein
MKSSENGLTLNFSAGFFILRELVLFFRSDFKEFNERESPRKFDYLSGGSTEFAIEVTYVGAQRAGGFFTIGCVPEFQHRKSG